MAHRGAEEAEDEDKLFAMPVAAAGQPRGAAATASVTVPRPPPAGPSTVLPGSVPSGSSSIVAPPSGDNRAAADLLYKEATELLVANEHAASLSVFERGLQLYPLHGPINANYGKALLLEAEEKEKAGEIDAAARLNERAVERLRAAVAEGSLARDKAPHQRLVGPPSPVPP